MLRTETRGNTDYQLQQRRVATDVHDLLPEDKFGFSASEGFFRTPGTWKTEPRRRRRIQQR